jgi:hypothetical protein
MKSCWSFFIGGPEQPETVLHPPSAADVFENRRRVPQLPRGAAHGEQGEADPDRKIVLSDDPELAGTALDPALQHYVQRVPRVRSILLVDNVEESPAAQLVFAITNDLAERLVHAQPAAVRR